MRPTAGDFRALVITLGICVLTLLAVLAWTPLAAADPADEVEGAREELGQTREELEEARGERAALKEQVDALNVEVSIAVEEYNHAQSELSQTEAAIAENQERLEQAQEDLAAAHARLEERIRGIYTGGRLGFLEALLTADSFSELFNRWELLLRVGSSDSEVVEQVKGFRSDVEARKKELAAERERREELVAQAEAARAEVEDKLAEREELLQGKQQEVALLEEEERQKQERLAAEREEAARREAEREAAAREAAARAQAEREAAAREAASSGGSGSSSSPSSSSSASPPAEDVPSSAVGSRVVEIAKQYIGVPYVWAGASPSGFDCSGLVQYVYRQVGINLPHSSRAQFGHGTSVPRSQLEPGDLVFFGSPIHHVGIYAGSGSMIHAPYTGVNVRIDSMDRRDYVGARRIR